MLKSPLGVWWGLLPTFTVGGLLFVEVMLIQQLFGIFIGGGVYGFIECCLIKYKVCEIFDGYLMASFQCSFDK